MKIGRWSELSVESVCQEHEVMRDADANETSGELGSALGGTLVGVFQLRIPCCCCLPTHMTLASGGSPMFPFVVHQPASPSIWPAVQSLRRGLSTNPGVTMRCAVEEMMCVVCVDVTEGG